MNNLFVKNLADIYYPVLDTKAVNRFLFYPRGGEPIPVSSDLVKTILIPIENNVHIGGKCHLHGQDAPNILFFHGNGEIVSDYDDFAPFFLNPGFNFIPVDYRGYGFSTGTPSITSMMRDCHAIFQFIKEWLMNENLSGPLIIMGRSLGSASALEIVCHYPEQISGLVIDSGFAYTGPLLEILGISTENIGFREEDGLGNLNKIKADIKPTLIIHGEYDEIIDVSEAKKLFEECLASEKKLLVIPFAGHNDLFIQGQVQYLEALKWLKGSIT